MSVQYGLFYTKKSCSICRAVSAGTARFSFSFLSYKKRATSCDLVNDAGVNAGELRSMLMTSVLVLFVVCCYYDNSYHFAIIFF